VIDAEYAAVKARLVADTTLVVRDTVYNADGTIFTGTYAVLFGGAPDTLDDDRFTAAQGTDSTATYVYTVRGVAPTADGARAVLKHVTTQLVGFVATVTGRKCDPIRLTRSTDVEVDASVRPPLFYSDVELTLISRRP